MQLKIVLIVFSLNFCRISTKNEVNSNLFKNLEKHIDGSDIEDTPSPEWIKYQQERFQNLDKLYTANQKPATSTDVKSKTETTSRQKDFVQEKVVLRTDFLKLSKKSSGDKITSAVEFPSIKGFIEFIKSLKEKWAKNSLFRIDDKIEMLHHLRDTLLKAIEQQFKIFWQDEEDDDVDPVAATANSTTSNIREKKSGDSRIRSKRGIFDESSINFPPDAALMSINFLTFAVFLIKLVLQVVNIIKSKHYQLSTVNMNTGGGMIMNG